MYAHILLKMRLNVHKELSMQQKKLKVLKELKKVGAAFLSTREVSSQECVYRAMPELLLRKIFPRPVFVNAYISENRIRVTKTQQELDGLDDDSTDVFK